jgi:hypothetical protein
MGLRRNKMKALHTPGPWFVGNKFTIATCSNNDDQTFGMLIPIADVYGENRVEDARLIAAAPDLLSSAVEFLAASEFSAPIVDHDEAMPRYKEADRALREAIARAKGVTK